MTEFEQQARATGQSVGLIVADIDHFKRVNDSHVHAVEDAVLKDVAHRLRKELRTFDLCYRIGGEEFGRDRVCAQPSALPLGAAAS